MPRLAHRHRHDAMRLRRRSAVFRERAANAPDLALRFQGPGSLSGAIKPLPGFGVSPALNRKSVVVWIAIGDRPARAEIVADGRLPIVEEELIIAHGPRHIDREAHFTNGVVFKSNMQQPLLQSPLRVLESIEETVPGKILPNIQRHGGGHALDDRVGEIIGGVLIEKTEIFQRLRSIARAGIQKRLQPVRITHEFCEEDVAVLRLAMAAILSA